MQHTALKVTCQLNELSVEKSSVSVEKVVVSSVNVEKVNGFHSGIQRLYIRLYLDLC